MATQCQRCNVPLPTGVYRVVGKIKDGRTDNESEMRHRWRFILCENCFDLTVSFIENVPPIDL